MVYYDQSKKYAMESLKNVDANVYLTRSYETAVTKKNEKIDYISHFLVIIILLLLLWKYNL